MIVPEHYVRSKCCLAYQDPSNILCVRCGRPFEAEEAVEQPRAPDVLVRCKKCNALIETTVHCDNCGTFEPTRG